MLASALSQEQTTTVRLVRPVNLQTNARYLMQINHSNKKESSFTEVTFLNHDVCPAFVIIDDGESRKRVLRQQLFLAD